MEAVGRLDGFYPDYRALRRAQIRAKNEPPRLTVGEEVFNAVSHGLGVGMAVTALVLLLLRSDTALEIMASCVYGISMLVMMLSSCLYHAMKPGSTVKRALRRLDYSSIYLLIGGTFAPILLVYFGNTMGVTVFCVQWSVILMGVILVAVFGKMATCDLAVLNDHELDLNTTMMYRHEDYVEAISLVSAGKIQLKPLMSKHFAFRDYQAAYEYIDNNRETTMKVLIDVDPTEE